ncbi:MAG: NAD(P)/FAD-dependent oxidoreductase [Planctomyces sp.]|nr:NAD(P)/FAD-dependent oxidoreductase [Planctomyces sp.]
MSVNASNAPLDFLIIGAGMSGMCMAIKLKEAGTESIAILEKSDDVGGTWLDNAYPNSGCDVPSFLYSYSFAPRLNWSQKYARQPEILQYFRDVADQFDIRKLICFRQTVTEARFDESTRLWKVRTREGQEWTARFLVSAVGQLNRPQIPGIPNAGKFRGVAWHSARWNKNVDLTGKRVAIIGNGASTIQFIPEVASKAARLTLFQRTPSWIHPLYNYHYPRWATWMFENLPLAAALHRLWIFLACEWRIIAFRRGSLANRIYRWWLIRQMKARLPDELHETMIPKYEPGCKRILLSSDYLETVQQRHVEVVSEPEIEFCETGIKTKDRQIDLDVVIYGTGFQATDFLQSIQVTGLRGVSLAEAWKQRPQTLLGMMTPDFPNLFLLYGPNTNLGHNSIIYMVEGQVNYLIQCFRYMQKNGHGEVEVRTDAVRRYDEELQKALGESVWAGDCGSWYKKADGIIPNNWFGPAFSYRRRLKHPDFGSYLFRPGNVSKQPG